MQRAIHRGFSLLELLVAVAIIGILARAAYPAYTSHVLKGRRAEARVALLDLMQSQERYATQNNAYIVFTTDSTGTTSTTLALKSYSGDSFAKSNYLLSAVACSNSITVQDCIKLIATPKGADPEVGDITLTSTGEKSCTGTDTSKCWN